MHGMKKTSWGHVANWYDSHLKEEGTYQKDLILPNLLRLMDIRAGDAILDLACGQGFFARAFHEAGGIVTGADISEELLAIARKSSPPEIRYIAAPADCLMPLAGESFDKAALVLCLQNIENAKGALEECRRTLRPKGRLYLVLNHPAFRIPRGSSWGWDTETGGQYRRIDTYLSESAIKIRMHPGDRPEECTISFHRPLQYYFKHILKAGFYVTRLEEWNSNRKSQPGPRADAENRARKEIPLFLFIEAQRA